LYKPCHGWPEEEGSSNNLFVALMLPKVFFFHTLSAPIQNTKYKIVRQTGGVWGGSKQAKPVFFLTYLGYYTSQIENLKKKKNY
jgi:hypothetical protein